MKRNYVFLRSLRVSTIIGLIIHLFNKKVQNVTYVIVFYVCGIPRVFQFYNKLYKYIGR
jgi:hypothetical protein